MTFGFSLFVTFNSNTRDAFSAVHGNLFLLSTMEIRDHQHVYTPSNTAQTVHSHPIGKVFSVWQGVCSFSCLHQHATWYFLPEWHLLMVTVFYDTDVLRYKGLMLASFALDFCGFTFMSPRFQDEPALVIRGMSIVTFFWTWLACQKRMLAIISKSGQQALTKFHLQAVGGAMTSCLC